MDLGRYCQKLLEKAVSGMRNAWEEVAKLEKRIQAATGKIEL